MKYLLAQWIVRFDRNPVVPAGLLVGGCLNVLLVAEDGWGPALRFDALLCGVLAGIYVAVRLYNAAVAWAERQS